MITKQDKKDLKAIADGLSYGDMQRIASKTGLTRFYVSEFFRGKHPINDKTNKIVDLAFDIITESTKVKNKVSQLAKKVK